MRALLVLLLCLFGNAANAQVFDRLYADSAQITLAQPLEWIVAPKGSITSPDVFVTQADAWSFQPYTADTTLPTSNSQEVWARFTLPATEIPQTWFIRIARMNIVKASLFSRDTLGHWQTQSAGESIAPAQWALRTRTPSFEVYTRSSAAQTYYLRFEHRDAITERPMLVSPIEYVDGASRVGAVVGLLGGMFGLLAILCVAAYVLARNTVFLWFGALVVALMLTQLVLIGFGGWRLWPHSVYLNQVMSGVAPALALAAGAWFCAQASYARDSHPRIYRLLCALAIGSLLIAVLRAFNLDLVSRELRNAWIAIVIVAVIGSLLWMSLRGQTWNLWLLGGLIPIGLAGLARLAYSFGWVTQVEFAQTAGVFSAQVGLLWIFLVLAWRSRAALLSTERAAALASYDAVTGLTLPRVADIRLSQMLLRANRLKFGCGILMLRWFDPAQGGDILSVEQRAEVLSGLGGILRRVARDIDTVARYDDNHFLILVEGPVNRDALTAISTQILASCIRASEKLDMPNAFKLHIAICLASLHPTSAQDVLETLKTRLNQMSFGTQRRVQFVDAAVSETAEDPEQEISLRREDVLAKINAIEALPNQPSITSEPGVPAPASSA